MRQELKKSDLAKIAPAIFAEEPASNVSDKYLFIPTYRIIDEMAKYNFKPVYAMQAKTSDRDNNKVIRSLTPFARHEIRFARLDMENKRYGGMPEMLIINGHDTRTGLRAYLGYHIFVCANGLVSGVIDDCMIAIHRKSIEAQIKEQLDRLFKRVEKEEKQIRRFQTIELTEVEKNKFAMAAYPIKFKKDSTVKPESLLQIRRPEDDNNSLWSVFNRVQENIIKGGVPIPVKYRDEKKEGTYELHTRPINEINKNTALNIALWNLMVQFASRKK